jgi:hypothetical protein
MPPRVIKSNYPSRFAVIETIIAKLFNPDDRRLKHWVDKLDGQNRELRQDNTLLGFLYLGRYFRPSHVEGKDPMGVKPCHPDLYSKIEAYLSDEKLVDSDKQFLRQGLYTLLDPCQSLQDVRDTLPECLVPFLPEIKDIDRDREPGFTLEGNPRGARQFEKLRDKLEAYAVSGIIF